MSSAPPQIPTRRRAQLQGHAHRAGAAGPRARPAHRDNPPKSRSSPAMPHWLAEPLAAPPGTVNTPIISADRNSSASSNKVPHASRMLRGSLAPLKPVVGRGVLIAHSPDRPDPASNVRSPRRLPRRPATQFAYAPSVIYLACASGTPAHQRDLCEGAKRANPVGEAPRILVRRRGRVPGPR